MSRGQIHKLLKDRYATVKLDAADISTCDLNSAPSVRASLRHDY